MMTILWARLVRAFTGITAQAIAITVAVALVIGGLWWLRADAAWDRDRVWEAKMANARVADQAKRVLRDRKQFEIALKNAQEWAAAMAQSEAARIEAERLLGEQRKIVWPKAVVRTINQ